MGRLIEISGAGDLVEGKIREYRVEGITVAMAKIDGEYFAFEASCTHAQCALAGGFLDGETLTCYCHGAQFDIKTGSVLAPPATLPLKTYPVKINKGKVFIEI